MPVGVEIDEVWTEVPVPVLAGIVSFTTAVEFDAGYGTELEDRGGIVNGLGEPAG